MLNSCANVLFAKFDLLNLHSLNSHANVQALEKRSFSQMRKMLELGRQDRYKFNNKEKGKFLKYQKNKIQESMDGHFKKLELK